MMRKIEVPIASKLPWTGERYVPGVSPELELDHVHRYLSVLDLCRGKDVLDVASGEGYGAYVLSQVAKSVVGVDVDGGAVEHAQKTYGGGRLSFETGD